MKRVFVLPFLLFIFRIICAQTSPLTIAEASEFKSTATYSDVTGFIKKLQSISDKVSVEEIALSSQGRSIPMMIIADPLPASPADLSNDKRVVVYIQANIHAGEVEGKEASLMFARDLLAGKFPLLLKNAVYLICPNFNPDGNELISVQNRPYQGGPVNGVGVRHNGQMLDLNRDAMKAESPEARGLLQNVFNRWDPQVFIDCHTTNGSYHVEPVTFTWMVNPNGDKNLISYMSKKMAPAISERLLNKHGVENCFYGEFADMLSPGKGWFFDAADPRYMTNYYGLRNRLAILNENYVYADYKSRVYGCYYLLVSLGEYVSENHAEIRRIVADSDLRASGRGMPGVVSDSFAVEYKARPLEKPVTIKTYEAEATVNEAGRRSYVKTDRRKDVTIPYYIDYYAVRSVRMPCAYIINPSDAKVLEQLKLHGIKTEILKEAWEHEAEVFIISELIPSPRLNQGHYTNNVKGSYVSRLTGFPAGSIIVKMSQPLSGLAAYLLEPESNDGLMLWNFFDKYLTPQWGPGFNPYPVYRISDTSDLPI